MVRFSQFCATGFDSASTDFNRGSIPRGSRVAKDKGRNIEVFLGMRGEF